MQFSDFVEYRDRLLASPFFIGGLGAGIALKWSPGTTFLERLFNTAAGSAMAGYLSGAIAEWLGLQTAQMGLAMAFLVGLFGMHLAAWANEWMAETKLSDVLPWIKKG